MKKKKFRLFDAILGTVCLTLVCESVMPTAAIGNTQYFWWLLLLVGFCLPYGMITAELGTTYPSEGGLYDWVKRAFGPRWAGRVAWNYWINFPLWIASLATAVTSILFGVFTNIQVGVWGLLGVQLFYIWLVTFLGTKRVGESKAVVNVGTAFKIILLLTIGILGLFYAVKHGSANPITSFKDLIPDLTNIGELSFISIILFNFMGFEVVGTWVDDMNEPKKDIPKALLFGGLLMAIFYVLPATGFNIALDPAKVAEMDPENVVEVLTTFFSSVGFAGMGLKVLLVVFGLMFIYTFIANIASWSFGVNAVAKYAADDGTMPKVFSKTNKEGVASNAAIINGIVASIISVGGIIAYNMSESTGAAFELFFCLSWITLLVGYIPLFLAFIKLRHTDNTKRVYRVPGGPIATNIIAFVPFVIIVLGVVFTIFGDFSLVYLEESIPLIIGVIVSFVIEEILVSRIGKSMGEGITAFVLCIIFTLLCLTKTMPSLFLIWLFCAIGTFIVGACHVSGNEYVEVKKKEE